MIKLICMTIANKDDFVFCTPRDSACGHTPSTHPKKLLQRERAHRDGCVSCWLTARTEVCSPAPTKFSTP
jgi:hypothetical protein